MTSNCHLPVAWRRSSYHPITHHDHAHGRASEREGRCVDRHAHLSARPPSHSHAVHIGKRRPGRGQQRGEAARMGMTAVCPSLAVPPTRPCPLSPSLTVTLPSACPLLTVPAHPSWPPSAFSGPPAHTCPACLPARLSPPPPPPPPAFA